MLQIQGNAMSFSVRFADVGNIRGFTQSRHSVITALMIVRCALYRIRELVSLVYVNLLKQVGGCGLVTMDTPNYPNYTPDHY